LTECEKLGETTTSGLTSIKYFCSGEVVLLGVVVTKMRGTAIVGILQTFAAWFVCFA